MSVVLPDDAVFNLECRRHLGLDGEKHVRRCIDKNFTKGKLLSKHRNSEIRFLKFKHEERTFFPVYVIHHFLGREHVFPIDFLEDQRDVIDLYKIDLDPDPDDDPPTSKKKKTIREILSLIAKALVGAAIRTAFGEFIFKDPEGHIHVRGFKATLSRNRIRDWHELSDLRDADVSSLFEDWVDDAKKTHRGHDFQINVTDNHIEVWSDVTQHIEIGISHAVDAETRTLRAIWREIGAFSIEGKTGKTRTLSHRDLRSRSGVRKPVLHVPVLLEEVRAALSVYEDAPVIDGTFGAGGYAANMRALGATVCAEVNDGILVIGDCSKTSTVELCGLIGWVDGPWKISMVDQPESIEALVDEMVLDVMGAVPATSYGSVTMAGNFAGKCEVAFPWNVSSAYADASYPGFSFADLGPELWSSSRPSGRSQGGEARAFSNAQPCVLSKEVKAPACSRTPINQAGLVAGDEPASLRLLSVPSSLTHSYRVAPTSSALVLASFRDGVGRRHSSQVDNGWVVSALAQSIDEEMRLYERLDMMVSDEASDSFSCKKLEELLSSPQPYSVNVHVERTAAALKEMA